MKRFLSFLLLGSLALSCLRDPEVDRNDPTSPSIRYDDLTRASVTLIGTGIDKAAEISYGFVVVELVNGEESGTTREEHISHLDDDGGFSWTTAVSPGKNYAVRSFITNGQSRKYSERLTISTPSTSKATVSNVMLADGLLSATLLDNGGRTIEEVGFVAGDTPERKVLLRKEKIPADRFDGNTFSLPLSSFNPNQTYYCVAYAIDEKEDVGYSPLAFEIHISDDDIVIFEDPIFEAYVVRNFDLNSDKKMSYGELKVITDIDVTTDNIASVQEIALMPDLKRLSCRGTSARSGKLSQLKIEKNAKLTFVACDNNLLEALSIADNKLLDTLSCTGNGLTGLAISGNPALDYLACCDNEITELDFSKNSGLRHIEVSGNPLAALDVSPCIALKVLECDRNQLSEFDIEANKKLERFVCSNNRLRTMDISSNRELNYVDCRENPLDTLFLYATQAPETLLVPDGTVLFYRIASVSLAEKELSLSPGATYQLTAVIEPEGTVGKSVTWSSSDPQVAAISETGLITGVRPGTCTITAECFGKKSTCEVTVTIPVSSVTFEEAEREVYIGENFTLTASIGPEDAADKALVWESSDPLVAAVSEEGAVTPVGIGTATITATAASGVSASFDCIVVSEAPVFPDENFRKYVYDHFDRDNDGFLSRKEISNVLSLHIETDDIYSIAGIEYFDNLVYLSCMGSYYSTEDGISGKLTSVNLLNNIKLETFECWLNPLSEINISDNNDLKRLTLIRNNIKAIDLSRYTKLESLTLSENEDLSYVDLSSCPDLWQVNLSHCNLSSIDVSFLPNLMSLYIGDNQLASLDITNNTQLQNLSIDGNNITSINLNNNTSLLELTCSARKTKIYERTPASIRLSYFSSTQLQDLDITHNPNLRSLSCIGNRFSTLDLSTCQQLESLDCSFNSISSLFISVPQNITSLYCAGNQITSLNLESFENLEYLDCSSNPLVSLNLDQNTKLKNLSCYNCQLETLDVRGCPELRFLLCYTNQLSELDISHCQQIVGLNCHSNRLSFLDLRNSTSYKYVRCYQNPLLTDIWLNKNQTIEDFQYDSSIATIHYE